MKNKKVLFLIPDGVGIRNYLYSDIIKHLKSQVTISFWSPIPKEAFSEVQELHDIDIEYKEIKFTPENILTRLFRESATYSRLLYNSEKVNNETILVNWRKKGKNFKLRQLYNLAETIGGWGAKKYKRILWLEKVSRKYWSKSLIDTYKKDLKELNPACIFITHQRVAALNPICIAAKELNIPVITAIYSWDNLPKARLAVFADKYIVWSSYMKEEMKTYYPEISQDKVLITGTPQFEFYLKKELILSRESFAAQHGLDKDKQWICFSGDDKTTSPNDPLYLRDIVQAMIDKESLNDIQILFRRAPADFSGRYDAVLAEYKDIIISIDPEWHTTTSGWTTFFPKFSDVALLVNMALHCDLVINVGSTMAHDFAILNKPCLYINYNKGNNTVWKSEVVYNYQHFRTMKGLDTVGWLNAKEEIVDKILLALHNPDTIGKDRKEWLKKIVQHPLEESSKKIASILLNN